MAEIELNDCDYEYDKITWHSIECYQNIDIKWRSKEIADVDTIVNRVEICCENMPQDSMLQTEKFIHVDGSDVKSFMVNLVEELHDIHLGVKDLQIPLKAFYYANVNIENWLKRTKYEEKQYYEETFLPLFTEVFSQMLRGTKGLPFSNFNEFIKNCGPTIVDQVCKSQTIKCSCGLTWRKSDIMGEDCPKTFPHLLKTLNNILSDYKNVNEGETSNRIECYSDYIKARNISIQVEGGTEYFKTVFTPILSKIYDLYQRSLFPVYHVRNMEGSSTSDGIGMELKSQTHVYIQSSDFMPFSNLQEFEQMIEESPEFEALVRDERVIRDIPGWMARKIIDTYFQPTPTGYSRIFPTTLEERRQDIFEIFMEYLRSKK